MALFSEAAREAQGWFRNEFAAAEHESPELYAALVRPSIADDAAHVDDLVARFSRAELEGRAIGRYGGVKAFPALGDLAEKRIESADQTAVRAAVARAVALGYVFMAAMQDESAEMEARAPAEIWSAWAPCLNTGLIDRVGLASDMISDMRKMGASAFREDAIALGLGGFGKKARLGHLGGYYAQAGAILRALHSHPDELQADLAADKWPYEDFPP